ncbi:MAG: hypothetical protein WBD36_00275 [Bacteroidota bacterium]
MKHFARVLIMSVVILPNLAAQPAGEPLTIQGLDQRTLPDVRARGMGGAILASGTNASVLFLNPAGLIAVGSMEFRLSASSMGVSQSQTQEWVPNRLYAGLSLMMEDKWGNIKSPTDSNGNPFPNPWEQLQKPFDTIGPNWKRSVKRSPPLSVAFAVPVEMDDIKFVFAIGGSQVSDLNYFFQNNNVTDPMIGSYRPEPLPELTVAETLRVRWYQFTRKRDGNLWGVTPAIAASFGGVSIGASATFYTGTSDDLEQRLDRGFLTFSNNRFRVQDTVQYWSLRTGTSTYSGFGALIGLKFEQPRYALAATIRLPYMLTREYSRAFSSQQDVYFARVKYNPSRTSDSMQTTIVTASESGKEEIRFPVSYSLGLVLNPFPKWTIAVDYEMTNYNQLEYKLDNGTVSNPWVNAPSFRAGAEYRWTSWLSLRGGYREVAQSFSPEGSAIVGDPAVMSAYSLGAGTNLFGFDLDLAYEYASLRYPDSWQSNVNHNSTEQFRFLAEVGVRF